MNKTKQNSSQDMYCERQNYKILKTSEHEYMVGLNYQREKDIFVGIFYIYVTEHRIREHLGQN